MKKIKSFKFFVIFFLFISCGYSPLYKDLGDINFSITVNETNGNRKINNLLKSKLSSYNSTDAEKNYIIKISSEYFKNIIAKDTTGAATEYKLIVNASFIVTSTNEEKQFNFKESFNMKSMNDRLEEQDYENNLKSNLVNTISKKLIMQLSQIK